MSHRLLWNSPAIPADLLEDDEFSRKVRSKVDELASSDSPSSGDMDSLFQRYNAATPAERDAMDAAFVWLTGYAFASIAAMVTALDPAQYEDVLAIWRDSRGKPR